MELLSLRSTHPDTRRMSFKKAASVGVHVLLLLALTYHFRGAAARVHHDKVVARILTPYSPGHKAAAAQPPKPKIIRPKVEPQIALKQPDPPPPPTSGDPTGEADVTVAMADFYPQPKPDLTLLPHGTKGDVVLLITIDEDGKVVDGHIDQGLGHGLDEAVLAVVETWTFTPATKAGKPVPSGQQLLFHFERA